MPNWRSMSHACVMVPKNCARGGYPGMAEVVNMSLPAKLLERGITDMVRVSDARMSGAAAAAGGPLGLVQDRDLIAPDVEARRLELLVDAREMNCRHERRVQVSQTQTSGYQWLFVEHVLQADQGSDFDFLVGRRSIAVPRESH